MPQLLRQRAQHRDFNPRLNSVYLLSMGSVPKDVIREIETDVIGYRPWQLSSPSRDERSRF